MKAKEIGEADAPLSLVMRCPHDRGRARGDESKGERRRGRTRTVDSIFVPFCSL